MKIFKLQQLAGLTGLTHEGEYVLCAEGAGTTALRWARLLPKETGRKVSSFGADTEIVYIVRGSISVRCGKSAFPVSAGEAFFINNKTVMEFDNSGDTDAVYIVACGHGSPTSTTEAIPQR